MEDETDKDLALEYFDEDLKEQSEDIDEDYEFEPPEENKAKKLNVNNIFIVLIAAVLLVIFIIVFVSKFTQTKKRKLHSLIKPGQSLFRKLKLQRRMLLLIFPILTVIFRMKRKRKKMLMIY